MPGENNMRGKEKCKILKQIRKRIADENDIPFVVEECEHKGECKGTCPKCEAELRELERALDEKEARGEKVDRTADIEPPEKKAVREFGFGDKPPFPEPLRGHIMPPPEVPMGERPKKQDRELSIRHRLGKAVAVAGVAAGLMATTTACTIGDVAQVIEYFANGGNGGGRIEGVLPKYRQLDGDVAIPPELEGDPLPDIEDEGGLSWDAGKEVDLGFLDDASAAEDETK